LAGPALENPLEMIQFPKIVSKIQIQIQIHLFSYKTNE